MRKIFWALTMVAAALVLVTALNTGNGARVAIASATPTPSAPPYYPALNTVSTGWQEIHNANDAVTLFRLPYNTSGCVVEIEGTLSSFSVAVEMSNDGVHWYPTQNTRPSPAPSASPGVLAANGQIQVNPAQFVGIRARLASTGGGVGYALVTCGPAVVTHTGGIGK